MSITSEAFCGLLLRPYRVAVLVVQSRSVEVVDGSNGFVVEEEPLALTASCRRRFVSFTPKEGAAERKETTGKEEKGEKLTFRRSLERRSDRGERSFPCA